MRKCMGFFGAQKKGPDEPAPWCFWGGSGRLGAADRNRSGREGEAEGDQSQRGKAVEKTLEASKTSERHDTHLSVGTPGEGGVFI